IDAETADESVNLGTGDDSAVASESVEEDEVSNVMNEDNLKGTGSSFTDLQNLINNTPANNTLTLDKDYAYSAGDSWIIINKTITIDGKNHVLDGKLSTSILYITGDYVTLKNIKFINANNTYEGGAVCWVGDNGNLKDCSFVNNHADGGGAVFWNGDNGTLKDCSFVNNHADSGGAVLWYKADYGTLSACSFVNNHAYGGGAVTWNDADYGTLSACSFANNHAKYGGAVAWGGDYGTLKDCSFVNNHAEYDGGAVHWNTEYGVLSLCSFTNNTANQSGNAIYVYSNTTNVSSCSFNIYRPTNTSTVTINNLIYCNETNYGVNYYENDKKIKSGQINDASVTFYNLDNGKHKIQMSYNSFINNIIINGDSYLSAGNVSMFYNDGTKYTIKLADHKGNPIANQNIQ
ncbi:right-handed parallel beta-helix repeat-containing protein, partial [Methanobrevibacter olleyae]